MPALPARRPGTPSSPRSAGKTLTDIGEFDKVDAVHCWVINAQQIFNKGDVLAELNVGNFVDAINTFLKPPDSGQGAFSLLSTIFEDILTTMAVFAAPEVAGPLFTIAALYGDAAEVTTLADGTPANGPLPYNTTVDTLATQRTDTGRSRAPRSRFPPIRS